MELELKKEQFACYQALPQLSENREETTETIVPDYLPDIARIVDASGCLFLRSREITDGKAQVSGTIRMTLLYVAEDTQGMKSFEYSLPLEEMIEGRALSSGTDCCLEGRLCSCEVRMLNPRKIFTRVNVELALTPYVPASLSVCSGVKEQEAYKIETLCEKKEITVIRAVREKDFTFADEVMLSGTKEPIRELLRSKCVLRTTDCKEIGNKIVLKGIARLDAVYLDEGGNLASLSGELPFSQILDGLSEEEGETTVRASLRLTGAEIHVGGESEPDNYRTVSLRLTISAFAAVRETRSVCCVTDLYSTAYELNAKTETVELCDSAAPVLREQLVREKIETGAEVQNVLAADVIFSSAGVSDSGASSALRATAHLRVLYLDENAVPLLSERRSEVLLETDLPLAGQARVQDVYAGEIAASVGADGVELRFPVTFAVSVVEMPSYPCLQSLQAEECEKKEKNVPSLVLRAMKPGERLWDIAKRYRTTVEAILAANELKEESTTVSGKLLLIPRRR